ncbi:MAG TPA: NAD-dependent epimerase/dehydratase family protein [Candidatus Binatia bacterium]|nr:NAD-dependent epimerase/dehydratase family protein [Candidatus Binatia bacterium]
MRVLVTGGAGFIGSNLCDALLKRGDEVFCLDNFNKYYCYAAPHSERYLHRKWNNLAQARKRKRFHLLETPSGTPVDIRNAEMLQKTFPARIDAVVHLAACAGIRNSQRAPATLEEADCIGKTAYLATNVTGTVNVIHAALARGVQQFVITSSSSVYGQNDPPWAESMRISPLNVWYAETKRMMERQCKVISELNRTARFTIVRPFSVYGPRGRVDMLPGAYTEGALRGTPVVMNGNGSQKRDYTYIDDVVGAYLCALDRSFQYEVINVGNEHPVAVRYVAELIEREAGRKLHLTRKKADPSDLQVTYASTKKAQELLAWKAKTSIEEGIAQTVAWYREQR